MGPVQAHCWHVVPATALLRHRGGVQRLDTVAVVNHESERSHPGKGDPALDANPINRGHIMKRRVHPKPVAAADPLNPYVAIEFYSLSSLLDAMNPPPADDLSVVLAKATAAASRRGSK